MATAFKFVSRIGKNQLQIETEGLKPLFMASGFFASIPAKCGHCGSDDLTLNGKKNSGFDFYGVLCRACNHELKFGQRKEDGGLFLKLDEGWQPPYEKGQGSGYGGGSSGSGGAWGQQRRQEDEEIDDIPF